MTLGCAYRFAEKLCFSVHHFLKLSAATPPYSMKAKSAAEPQEPREIGTVKQSFTANRAAKPHVSYEHVQKISLTLTRGSNSLKVEIILVSSRLLFTLF
jgi:hypothetical protein